ncbi:hypothetical protein ABT317_13910 [Streptomyces carpinensis]|uniref:Uncharacterized protein n=1 Tax=Streptomyces carpinensis TaxID=66369 RepID=A0ABV1W1K4_9ACTN
MLAAGYEGGSPRGQDGADAVVADDLLREGEPRSDLDGVEIPVERGLAHPALEQPGAFVAEEHGHPEAREAGPQGLEYGAGGVVETVDVVRILLIWEVIVVVRLETQGPAPSPGGQNGIAHERPHWHVREEPLVGFEESRNVRPDRHLIHFLWPVPSA